MKNYNHKEIIDYVMHIILFAMAFMVMGYYAPKIYLHYFDKRVFYKITNPVTVENKINYKCQYVDAYMHRIALAPIKGQSVKKLILIRSDNYKDKIETYTTDVEADIGEATIITHWKLPCNIPSGNYFFEGVVEYKVFDITRYTTFYTENFIIQASGEAKLNTP